MKWSDIVALHGAAAEEELSKAQKKEPTDLQPFGGCFDEGTGEYGWYWRVFCVDADGALLYEEVEGDDPEAPASVQEEIEFD